MYNWALDLVVWQWLLGNHTLDINNESSYCVSISHTILVAMSHILSHWLQHRLAVRKAGVQMTKTLKWLNVHANGIGDLGTSCCSLNLIF